MRETMAGSWLQGGGNGNAVDVVELLSDAQLVKGFAEMVAAGALVSLGTTSDGGALGITVTINGEWRREYVRSHDELAAYLAEAVPGVTDELAASGRQAPPRDASAAPRGRSRRR
jgi:hypothetical protein